MTSKSAEQRQVADDREREDQCAPQNHGWNIAQHHMDARAHRLPGGGMPVDDQGNRHHRDGKHAGCQNSADDDIGQNLRAVGRVEKSLVQRLAYIRSDDVKHGAEQERGNPEPDGGADGEDDPKFKQGRRVSGKAFQ